MAPRSFENLLVPVQHDGGTLEWNPPGLAAGLAVLHEGGKKALDPTLVRLALGKLVERNDRFLVDQREHVHGQEDGSDWRVARFVRGQSLDDRFLIGAGVNRLDADSGIFLLEIGDIA